jgi:hypothetical protein
MNMATKQQIFERYYKEYPQANARRKGEILTCVADVTHMHRKAVIRRFRALQVKDRSIPERRGRPTVYTKDVDAALFDVWGAANRPCGEILYPVIEEYVSIFKRDRMWQHSTDATDKLLAMKERTVKRRIGAFRTKRGKLKGISSTKPSHLKAIIPIFKGPWKRLPPGHGQLDTVAHCGSTLLGDFVFSVNYTDAATYWLVCRAQWNKGQHATVGSMKEIHARLPFTLRELHPDTGSEFINWTAKKWCDEEHIHLSRSEPGKKNDNMYVEERNGHVVREYLGYIRLDDREIVPVVNEFYEVLCLYLNHFVPVRRTLSKERVGAKYRRTYEKRAKTAYTRTLEHTDVLESVKEALTREHEQLNPLLLKQKLDTLRRQIFNFSQSDRGDENRL